MDNNNVFTVKKPANNGRLLLKMKLNGSPKMIYKWGLFLDSNSGRFKGVTDLINEVENLCVVKRPIFQRSCV